MSEPEYGICETCLDEKPESDLVDGVCSTCREAAAVDAGEPVAAEPDPAVELAAARVKVERLREAIAEAREALIGALGAQAGSARFILDKALRRAAPGSPPAEGGEG